MHEHQWIAYVKELKFIIIDSKYPRMDRVEFMEDSLGPPLLNTLSHLIHLMF